MRGMVRSIGREGGLLPSILTLVLLFRLLIPSGYMIVPDHEGRPGLTLCAAPAQASVEPAFHTGHDGHGADPAPSNPGERPCPFAALTAPPLPPAPAAIPARAPAAVLSPDLPPGPVLGLIAPAASPPPSTGPPLSV